jgi:LmbE family N-acetylglucosaminyl deacetylase
MAEVSSRPPRTEPGGSVVVISPHLDDAALSVGATIAATAASGGRVIVLTVLAGDPASSALAEEWDASAGFATHGEAARARRHEDTRACAILGATPAWLGYNDEQYERGADDATIRSAMVEALRGAGAVLIPGYPLTHPDHAWLAQLALAHELPCARVGLYVEQPYTWLTTGAPVGVAEPIADLVPAELRWERKRHRTRDNVAKLRACLAYRSQLPLLGRRRILRAIASDLKRGGEAVAWLPR